MTSWGGSQGLFPSPSRATPSLPLHTVERNSRGLGKYSVVAIGGDKGHKKKGEFTASGICGVPMAANHSCEPNMVLDAGTGLDVYGESYARTFLVVTEDVAKGTELTFDYLAGDGKTAKDFTPEERAEKLGFVCQCTLCRRQAAAAGRGRRAGRG